MQACDMRLLIFSAIISELYKNCGLSPATPNSTPVPVCEKEFCTNILGADFHLVFNSPKKEKADREIVVCDICFDTPSKEFVDRFAQKVESISMHCPQNIVSIIIFTCDIPLSIVEFAHGLGVYTLSYQDNPVLQALLRRVNELCKELIDYDVLYDDAIRLKHEILGYFGGYFPMQLLRSKPYFIDGFQTSFMEMRRLIYSYKAHYFAKTSGGWLINCMSADFLDLKDTCKITTRTKGGYRYKMLKFDGVPDGLIFSLPTETQPRMLFNDEKHITLKLFDNFKADSFTIYVE